jgi:two-component system, cell cycle response regulator
VDTLLQTIKKDLHHLAPGNARRDAILVHIYPTGQDMGRRYVVGAKPLFLGRGENCDIRIHDGSVSRRHAYVQLSESGCSVTDLGSLNGTFLNDTPVTAAVLSDGDYLRVGNCIYRFLTGGNVEAEYHEEIYRLTIIDALTETHNKRYFLEFLDRELSRSERHGRVLSLVMLDIDHFKAINDRFTHLAGDVALRELSARIRAKVRKEELFARCGGEEFAVVLPETTCEDAVAFAERIREEIAARPFEYDGTEFSVTISLGVASTTGHVAITPQELIQGADRTLYRAKNGGRNRVCIWTDDDVSIAKTPGPAGVGLINGPTAHGC